MFLLYFFFLHLNLVSSEFFIGYVLQGKNDPNKTSLKKQSEFQRQSETKSEHSNNEEEAYPFFELRVQYELAILSFRPFLTIKYSTDENSERRSMTCPGKSLNP